MRGAAKRALTASALALTLAGCGSTSSGSSTGGSSSPGSSTPRIKVTAAVAQLANESYRERLTLHTRYDTSGLAPAVAARFAAAPTAISANAAFENPRRISIVESIPPLLANVHLVLYDGGSYVALDGIHFRRLTGPLAATLGNFASLGPQASVRYITDVRALGAANVDGQAAEHYGARLDTHGVRSLTARLLGSLGINADAIGVGNSQVDIYLNRRSGKLIRLATIADTTLDLAKLRIRGPSGLAGTLKIHQDATVDIYDTGATVTVTRP